MKNFIKESLEELEHVVWPTEQETRTYLNYNLFTIISLTILLVTMGFLIRNGLSSARDLFPHTAVTQSADAPATKAELDDLLKNVKLNTGSTDTATGTETTPGAINPLTLTGN